MLFQRCDAENAVGNDCKVLKGQDKDPAGLTAVFSWSSASNNAHEKLLFIKIILKPFSLSIFYYSFIFKQI